MADRWAYVPLIGLFIMTAWWIPDFTQSRAGRACHRKGLATLVLVILAALMVSTGIQIRYWKNSMTLFQHALGVNSKNWVAHNNLGTALAALGRNTEAYAHFSEALKLNPKSARAHVNAGVELLGQGKIDAAISQFRIGLQLKTGFAESHNNTCIYARQDLIQESINYLDKAIQKGFNGWGMIKTDSDLANIRKTNGYQLLVKG